MRMTAQARGWLLAPVFALLALAGCASVDCCAVAATDPLQQALIAEGIDPARAALVIYRIEDEKAWVHGGPRISQRFPPASTSKIPHMLIALETGAVSAPSDHFDWDGTERSIAGWNESQDFATAFRRSTVWIYQIVVPRIGAERLVEAFTAFGYGNAEIGGPDDLRSYWLNGPLEISAVEQVGFLARLARRTLPLSASTYAQAVPIMALDSGDGWTLYAKTGWKSVPGETDLGWFAGWLEQTVGEAPGTYVFAFNMDMDGSWDDAGRRRPAVERALRAIGALAGPSGGSVQSD